MTDPEGKLRLIFVISSFINFKAKKGEASDWFDIEKIEKKRKHMFELVQEVEEKYQNFVSKY